MQTSKSSKWDPTVGAHVTYDKHNVLSTEMAGGDMCVRSAASAFFACAQRIGPSPLLRYYSAPLLHQYAVAFVRSIVAQVSVLQFPFFRCFFRLIYLTCCPELSKCLLERQCRQVRILFIQRIPALVVTHLTAPNSPSAPVMAHTSTNTTTTRACPRIPSHYYPNLCASFENHSYHPHSFPFFSGGSDLRKLTAVYYLNPAWNNALGGLFRIYQSPPNHGQFTDIEPAADRLLVFWCVALRSICCAGL